MTDRTSSVESRLEWLEARAFIADLVHRYARCVRTGDTADCVNLFAEDATFEVREQIAGDAKSAKTRSRLESRAAIVEYLSHGSASGGSVCPVISNLLIEVSGKRASSNCVMTAIVWGNPNSVLGEYHDTYRLEDGWRFESRVYTILRART